MKTFIIALALGLSLTANAHAGAANWRIYRCVQADGKPITLRFSMGLYPGHVSGSTEDFDSFNGADENGNGSDIDVMVSPDRDHPKRVITIHGIASSDQTIGSPPRSLFCGRPIYR